MARLGSRDGQIGEAVGADADLHQMHQRGLEGAVSGTGQRRSGSGKVEITAVVSIPRNPR